MVLKINYFKYDNHCKKIHNNNQLKILLNMILKLIIIKINNF